MLCRVTANFAFDVDIPVESDLAGWTAADKGGRLAEQGRMWEHDLPQLLSFVAGAKEVQVQLTISEQIPFVTATEEEIRRQMGEQT